MPASGIRKFFDILMSVDDVISLGIGEPDYVTPAPLRDAAIKSITQGKTHYTSNYGMFELREQLSEHLKRLYDVTKKQLDEWGAKYHDLQVGNKPHFDVYICDKSHNADIWFGDKNE